MHYIEIYMEILCVKYVQLCTHYLLFIKMFFEKIGSVVKITRKKY